MLKYLKVIFPAISQCKPASYCISCFIYGEIKAKTNFLIYSRTPKVLVAELRLQHTAFQALISLQSCNNYKMLHF